MSHEQSSKFNSIANVQVLSTEPLSSSAYIKPMRMRYVQDGVEKIWDYVKTHNSVSVLIHNVTRKCIVLVRQFRPAVFIARCAIQDQNPTGKEVPTIDGVTYELCAGLVDRPDKCRDIAASEVLEETGYKVSPETLHLISKSRSGVGISGSLQSMYYVEVTDDMKVTDGGGCESEGEMIDLYHLKVSEVKSFLEDTSITNRPSGLLFALSWFLQNKV